MFLRCKGHKRGTETNYAYWTLFSRYPLPSVTTTPCLQNMT